MARLAIREELLPGADLRERMKLARALGFAGLEFAASGLDARIDELDEALRAHGLRASGLNMGAVDGWVSADIARRARANDMLREALACALDLEADYVTFVPHFGASDMPDLTPFASPLELQKELLIWLLRGFSDLAEAMDAKLALLPLCRAETSFLTHLGQAARFRQEVDDHPNITLAASACDLALEEDDLLAALASHAAALSVIYLTDSERALAGAGHLPFPAIGKTLNARDYQGWLVLDGRTTDAVDERIAELRACLEYLQGCDLC
ncbi:MAG: sugar phosphate isomerase/epimerase [Chloroflexi bacterium]|nr:sugar phosphate isomerase/epimerase [Chloroflexota bacterium]